VRIIQLLERSIRSDADAIWQEGGDCESYERSGITSKLRGVAFSLSFPARLFFTIAKPTNARAASAKFRRAERPESMQLFLFRCPSPDSSD
jgi:hypothetical protein